MGIRVNIHTDGAYGAEAGLVGYGAIFTLNDRPIILNQLGFHNTRDTSCTSSTDVETMSLRYALCTFSNVILDIIQTRNVQIDELRIFTDSLMTIQRINASEVTLPDDYTSPGYINPKSIPSRDIVKVDIPREIKLFEKMGIDVKLFYVPAHVINKAPSMSMMYRRFTKHNKLKNNDQSKALFIEAISMNAAVDEMLRMGDVKKYIDIYKHQTDVPCESLYLKKKSMYERVKFGKGGRK